MYVGKNNKQCDDDNTCPLLVKTEDGHEFSCDVILDCTYNQLQLQNLSCTYEITISLLYKQIRPANFDAITVMDGKFFSLYPRDLHHDLYSLTDVEYSPLISAQTYAEIADFKLTSEHFERVKKQMEDKVQYYFPQFNEYFQYESFFLSTKTKLNSMSDSRETSIQIIDSDIISVHCGKIYGIFEWEDYVVQHLDNKINV